MNTTVTAEESGLGLVPMIAAIVEVDVTSIRETPENWEIYREPADDDAAFADLCTSIADAGINTPLELSADLYIISGHRRYRAALKVGLTTVPAITDHTIIMQDLTSAERIKLLTERNRGTRVKTDAEAYLEAAAQVDPEAAIRAAQARKAEHFNKAKCSVELVEERGKSRRTDPSRARGALLKAVMEVIEELRAAGLLPNSSRHLHYQLLRRNVRTSTYKSGYIYGTEKGSAGLLSKLMTDARSAGFINPDDVNDETRPTEQMRDDGSVGRYVACELNSLFKNYFSPVHVDQPNHVELVVEKNTIFPLLYRRVAAKFRIPITSMRGYGSFPVARDVNARFKKSGKDKAVVIYVADLDPEGVNMPAAVKKYLRVDFGLDVTMVRAAVTREQIDRFNLPPDTDVKLSSSRAKGFIKEYGQKCWELDSMPGDVLIAEVSKAVSAFLDLDALNRAFEREKQADVKLARLSAAVAAFVRDNASLLEGGLS